MLSQPSRNYSSNDVVFTPDALAEALVRALNPSGVILEPCAGAGAFIRALSSYGTVRSCEAASDDLGFTWWTERVDWVVTNPPWSQFAVFLRHAMQVSDDIAFLVTVNHWWTKRRVRDVHDAGFGYKRLILCEWPPEWPSSGFQLGMMHLQRGYAGSLEIQRLRYR